MSLPIFNVARGQATVDQEAAKDVSLTYGIQVDGQWAGKWKMTVNDGQLSYESVDDLSAVQALFHYQHPSDMVLTAYQRFQGGKASGDQEVIDTVQN